MTGGGGSDRCRDDLAACAGMSVAVWVVWTGIWMLAVDPALTPARKVVRLMERRLPLPELDSQRVGLTLVGVTYGVALGSVFAATAHGYNEIEAPGWSQLGLAATAIVLSWIGF
jgi:hypothetical protein